MPPINLSLMLAKSLLRALVLITTLASCGTLPGDGGGEPDRAILWVKSSAEYQALALQAYRDATGDLPGKLADRSWSALPEQHNAGDLPPAVILDVDETAVSNVRFQESLTEPFRDSMLNTWGIENVAEAVPGAVAFVQLAVDSGVRIFFLTNRPCEPGPAAACPQKQVVIGELMEAGFPADETNVTLAFERPEWTKEKSIRRSVIASGHRVIMLFGDDLGDFIACTRKRPLDPCTVGATEESRRQLVERHAALWGEGWYILPNPMHGSWTSLTE